MARPSGRVLASAILLDALAGDPPNAVHPVAWLGKAIDIVEASSPQTGPRRQLLYGLGIALTLPLAAAIAVWSTEQRLIGSASGLPALIARAAMLKAAFAVRGLLSAGATVRELLAGGNLSGARYALRALVSRRTEGLPPSMVAAAAIESLAENTVDSFLAPWFYYALFGLPGAGFYRAVNTLDSRLGYHSERYEYLGKASARLDDALNFVPARLAAVLIAFAARLASPTGNRDAMTAWRTARRDNTRTESPNAGWPMSAMAGALGVVLEKEGHYRLGENGRPPNASDIARAEETVRWVAVLGALLGLAVTLLRNVAMNRIGKR